MAKTYSFLVFCLLALALVRFVQAAKYKCTDATNTFISMKKLSEDDKQKLLDYHNKFREITASGEAPAPNYGKQPPAANMYELTWNDYAAKKAYELASTCKWKHDNPTDISGNKLGQNLAKFMSTQKTNVNKTFDEWTHNMVKGWFDEAELYEFGSGFKNTTAHYTQMVWAKTMQVGCGYSYFEEIDEKNDKWFAGYLVCNYRPGGNMEGKDPYIKGNVDCESHRLQRASGKYPHLCKKKK